jgi:hypothetical protein
MTDAEVDAELTAAGGDPVKIGDMGRAIAYLGKVARFRWPGGLQQSELERLLAEVRLHERRRIEIGSFNQESARVGSNAFVDPAGPSSCADGERDLLRNHLVTAFGPVQEYILDAILKDFGRRA